MMIFFVASLDAQSGHISRALNIATKNVIVASPAKHTVRASWYGPGFFENKLASGKPYRKSGVFVAHRSYPFGTMLMITNPHNHRTIIASVEDRGPYQHGRTLDLSYEAARELGMITMGITHVSYCVMKIP
jgi:rare lipoprotein A